MIELVVLTFLTGISLGSFLNVCIYRIPRGLSVVAPRSYCPRCKTTLGWLDLIPLLSFALRRGRCSSCSYPISWSYPIVELLSGVLTVVVLVVYGLSISALEAVTFLDLMILFAVIDWRHYLIPNRILVVGFALVCVLKAISAPESIADSLVSLAFAFAATLVVALLGKALLHKETMGMGDVKLSALIGFSLGSLQFLVAFWCAAVLALAFSAARSVVRARREHALPLGDERLPFGSFLAAAASGWVLFAATQLTDVFIPSSFHDWPF